MTSIYDIPKKDVDAFFEKNKNMVNYIDPDPYITLFEMIKSENYIPYSVPNKIVDWIISYNLKLNNVKINEYNILDIYSLSNEEIRSLSKLLNLDNEDIESIINILDYLGKLDKEPILSLKLIPIDVIKFMLKPIKDPEIIKNFCITNKFYQNICYDDNFWKNKYIETYENKGINYLLNNKVKDYQELYKLNYNYDELSKKLRFFRDFGFWFNIEGLSMRNRKLKEFPKEIFMLTKLN
jgi:hypothetical protein